jgi:acetolactate synthase-1/2/3 large subunit
MWGRAWSCWRIAFHNAGALLDLREGILKRLTDRATEDRWPPTPQRIVHDVRQVIPEHGIVALDNGMYKIWFARNYRTYVANSCWTTRWRPWAQVYHLP